MMSKSNLFMALVCGCFLAAAARAELPEGYYRFPAIHQETIVFAAEGDLWSVDRSGGIARRITSHPGEESHPVISPDGQVLAFSATYEGPTELYSMPVAGGLPVRWTFEGDPTTPVGFSPDGQVLYTTTYYSSLPDPLMVTLDLATGDRSRIPLNQASDGTYDDSGRTLYFVRPQFHNNNTKRYQGGTARNIWKFVDGWSEAENLTSDFPGGSHSPMWWSDRVYFVSDRDGTMNIWSMDADGRDLRQHTRHSGWDVFSPDLSEGRIVYQLGADLRLLDIASGEDRRVPIQLTSDFDQLRERWVEDPMEYLTSAHIQPEGEKVVLTARGRVFVAPVQDGRLVRASSDEGVRYRDVTFSADGDRLIALSDETGELELTILPANGVGDPEPLTDNGQTLRFRPLPSPDGRWIAFSDKNNDLFVLDVETRQERKISTNREGIGQLDWAPDSRWIAFSERAVNTYLQIFLFNVEDGTLKELTSDRVNSVSPAWSPDGQFLYFLSDRELRSLVSSPWGPRQPEPYFDRVSKIYVVPLGKGVISPFKPANELAAPTAAEEEEGTESPVRVDIDLEGLELRVRSIPVPAGNYASLSVNDKALFWTERGSERGAPVHLRAIDIGNDGSKPTTVVEDIVSYELSMKGEKALVRKGDALYVVDASARKIEDLAEYQIDLDNWSFSMDMREDFRQLMVDAWRLERDYFYDPGMHGLDWDAILGKYLPLVDRVTNRMELSDLIGQLVSEMSALHVSVRGGDHRTGPEEVDVASLGARLWVDRSAGGYRIDYIYQSDPDYPDLLSPLADPDLGIEVNDVITSINGADVLSVQHLNSLLRNQENRQTLLTVRSGETRELRDVIVVPTSDERNLRYRDWEYTRRLRVEEQGEGEIGYVHLRAMGANDLTDWYKNFYPVFNRQGLILDMRHNRGGNIDSIILEKLIRQAWFYWQPRVGNTTWNMQYAFRGHMVVLVDAQTASDGEAFAEGFRRLGLGQVIGTRTWGGEIWLGNNNRLTDGGLARAPQTGVFGPEGEWLIEGHGVDPDIVVDNLPHGTFNGGDAQLDTAVEYLKDMIRSEPVEVPSPPAHPDKSFPNVRGESGVDG